MADTCYFENAVHYKSHFKNLIRFSEKRQSSPCPLGPDSGTACIWLLHPHPIWREEGAGWMTDKPYSAHLMLRPSEIQVSSLVLDTRV